MRNKRIAEERRQGDAHKNASWSEEQNAYFLSLTLANIRCFGAAAQTLELSTREGVPARWTVLLGENGTGKTTILQALAAFEPYLLPNQPVFSPQSGDQPTSWTGTSRFGQAARGFWWTEDDAYRSLFRTGAEQRPTLWAKTACESRLTTRDGQFKKWQAAVLLGHHPDQREPEPSTSVLLEDPPIYPRPFGYGAGRRFSSASTIDAVGLAELDTRDATASLFFDGAVLKNAEEWLLQLDYSAAKKSEIQTALRARLDQVVSLLTEILPDVSGIRFTVPSKATPAPQVQFETPYGWVALRQISYGYRTLVAWMVDFASRMIDRYPNSENPLAEPAVVLVDEIDLHLHPKWQRQLMTYLTQRFPNTQFIVTAHSPLVVQAAEGVDANIALLRREGDHVVIDNAVEAVSGWRVDQILTSDLFGLPSARSPAMDAAIKRREELLTKPVLQKAERDELAGLDEQIGRLPGGETAAEAAKNMRLVEETLRLLGKKI